MRIGVLLATYNGVKYLGEQLDSIINQTVNVDEIIVSDDGSSDGTIELVESYIKRYPEFNIRLCNNIEPHGPSKNFENAFKHSSADYLFFSDQDDVWKSNKVELFVGAIKKYPDSGMFFSNADITDGSLVPSGKTVWESFFAEAVVDGHFNFDRDGYFEMTFDYAANRIVYGNFVTGMSMMVSRNVLESVIPFSRIMFHDDYITSYSCLNSRVCLINQCTALYRQHGNNVVGSEGGFAKENSRRSSLQGIRENSEVSLKELVYSYVHAYYVHKFSGSNKNRLISLFFRDMKIKLSILNTNKFVGIFKILVLLHNGFYYRFCYHSPKRLKSILKFFLLDLGFVLFTKEDLKKLYYQKAICDTVEHKSNL